MTDQLKIRKIEVYNPEGDTWMSTPIEKILKGDILRMFEPDGQPVKGTGPFEGITVFKASENFDGEGIPCSAAGDSYWLRKKRKDEKIKGTA